MFSNESDQAAVECRICHSRTTRDLILSPCLCKGTMGCVHIRCLEQWLNFSSLNFCELCSYRFEVIQVRRYSLLKSIRVWVSQQRGSLYRSVFWVLLSTTNAILLSWMWFLWISNFPVAFSHDPFTENEPLVKNKSDLSETKWIAVCIFLTLLTSISIKSLCIDGYRRVKSEFFAWYRWWNQTVNVQLVLDLENYKIKNRLDELQDISLGYAKEKAGLSNQDATAEIADFRIGEKGSCKVFLDMPDTNAPPSKVSFPGTARPTENNENMSIDDSKNVQDNNLNPQDKKGDSERATTTYSLDVIFENPRPNPSLDDLPRVHNRNGTDQM
ncbi:uncharacterized protein LOC128982431 [Macrosteles quadrilineatus]|uniref:uncharacterized protein LOC128982431 n=1 Tax=Macrosteles quadrilineatus TaxID=74068 RepID=UPI0023E1720A|nr:uncharacterized protein LOC128982431 [Macrosteles quadrilineatus]